MTDIAQDPWVPTNVSNMNIPGIVERMDRMTYEMLESEAAKLNDIPSFDIKRIQDQSAALQGYVKTIYESAPLDLPHSYEAMYPIHYATQGYDYDATKNKAIRDLARYLVNGWVQWSRSESADRSNGLYPADYNRFVALMATFDNLIDAYIKQYTPLDTPAQSQYEIESNANKDN
jgi:hypothetical protein